MSRFFQEKALVLATRNQGKKEIFQDLFKEMPFFVHSIDSYAEIDPEETGETFFDNALLKARAYAPFVKEPLLADDSGLVIPSLGGIPGVRSSRFAAEKGGYPAAFDFLKESLEGKDPSAYLQTVLVLLWPDGHFESFSGKLEGTLQFPAQGEGFGYTPIFVPHDKTKTIAQMSLEERSVCSHRRVAIKALFQGCFSQ